MSTELPHPDCEKCKLPNHTISEVHLLTNRLEAVEMLAKESRDQREVMQQSLNEILEALVGNPHALVKEKRRGMVDDVAKLKADVADIKTGNVAKQGALSAVIAGIVSGAAAFFTHKP